MLVALLYSAVGEPSSLSDTAASARACASAACARAGQHCQSCPAIGSAPVGDVPESVESMQSCAHACMRALMRACVCMHACVHMSGCVHACMHGWMSVYIGRRDDDDGGGGGGGDDDDFLCGGLGWRLEFGVRTEGSIDRPNRSAWTDNFVSSLVL